MIILNEILLHIYCQTLFGLVFKMAAGGYLEYEIERVSLDKNIPMVLGNFHTKGDLCIMT